MTRESIVEQIEAVTGISPADAERKMKAIEQRGEQVKLEGVSDIVDVYNELLETLGLPATGAPAEHLEATEHSLGQMSDLLTNFHHAVRRATPRELYQEVSGGATDEAKEDAAVCSDEAKPEDRVLGATRGVHFGCSRFSLACVGLYVEGCLNVGFQIRKKRLQILQHLFGVLIEPPTKPGEEFADFSPIVAGAATEG